MGDQERRDTGRGEEGRGDAVRKIARLSNGAKV